MNQGFDADVVVVGGGISGLACAMGIERQGGRVVVLEAEARTGGCIGTAREQGYLLESGPNSALDTTPLMAALFDALDISAERIFANPEAGNRYVDRDGALHALPLSLRALVATPLFFEPCQAAPAARTLHRKRHVR